MIRYGDTDAGDQDGGHEVKLRSAFLGMLLLLQGCVPDPFLVITLGEEGRAADFDSVVTLLKGAGFEEALPPGFERPLQRPAGALRSVFLQRSTASRLGCFVDEVSPPKPLKIYCRDMDARLNESMPPRSKAVVKQLAMDLKAQYGEAVVTK